MFFKGQNTNKGSRSFLAEEEKFCNDTNGDTYPEGGRYWVNCNHGYCQCTARSQEPYSSKNSQKYCHLNQHSFATCARGTYIDMSSDVEFQKWWVLKSKNQHAPRKKKSAEGFLCFSFKNINWRNHFCWKHSSLASIFEPFYFRKSCPIFE